MTLDISFLHYQLNCHGVNMDKFGYIRGRRGPPGPPGKDALQLDVWCSKSLLKQFQASATCSFYFDDETDGILYDSGKAAIGLKNRVDDKKNAICLRGFNMPVKTKVGSYSIPLSVNSCYEIKHISSAINPRTVLIVAFSFRLIKPIKDGLSYYIFSNTNSTRAVTLRKDWLDIAGCAKGSPQLEYNKVGWNRMILQYSRVTEEGSDLCFFILNGRRGSFEPTVFKEGVHELYIGHKIKKTANIELNYFEVHTVHFRQLNGYVLPEIFSTLLLNEMQQRVMMLGEECQE